MTITNSVSLAGLSTSIQLFLTALNEYGVSFNDLANELKIKTNNLIYLKENIDFTTTGDNLIFTVPSGKKIIITNVFIIPSEVVSFTSEGIISIGKNPTSYNDIFENLALSNLDTINKFFQFNNLSHVSAICSETEEIKLKVNTAAVATTFKATCMIFGFYI